MRELISAGDVSDPSFKDGKSKKLEEVHLINKISKRERTLSEIDEKTLESPVDSPYQSNRNSKHAVNQTYEPTSIDGKISSSANRQTQDSHHLKSKLMARTT